MRHDLRMARNITEKRLRNRQPIREIKDGEILHSDIESYMNLVPYAQ